MQQQGGMVGHPGQHPGGHPGQHPTTDRRSGYAPVGHVQVAQVLIIYQGLSVPIVKKNEKCFPHLEFSVAVYVCRLALVISQNPWAGMATRSKSKCKWWHANKKQFLHISISGTWEHHLMSAYPMGWVAILGIFFFQILKIFGFFFRCRLLFQGVIPLPLFPAPTPGHHPMSTYHTEWVII